MSRLLGEDDLFDNKIGEKIRRALSFHVRASKRAYTTYLDSLRINVFAKLAEQVNEYNQRKGLNKDEIIDTENNVTLLQDQMIALAEFINFSAVRNHRRESLCKLDCLRHNQRESVYHRCLPGNN